MWKEALKISTVLAVSGVKFLAGVPLSFAYHYSCLQTVILTSTGGIVGVLVMMFCSDAITRAWFSTVTFFKKRLNGKNPPVVQNLYEEKDINVDLNVDVQYYYGEQPVIKSKKIFSKKTRLIVKFKMKYGLAGIAFLTPILLSVPVGTFISTKLTHNKLKIFIYMLVAIVAWSVLLTTLTQLIWHQKA
jgi:hypothetical protein